MSAHDRYLAAYSSSEITVYCANRACPNADGMPVRLESEYGQSWITPEDCPDCNGELLDEPAKEDEDDDV